MPKWINSVVLDPTLQYIKDNCTSIRLLSTYAAADTYATVVANTLANVTVTSSDFTLANGSLSARTLTQAVKTDAAADASGGGATNHIAFCTASVVLMVTPESSGQYVTMGNPIVINPITLTANQPT
jgi:hypothetical protein